MAQCNLPNVCELPVICPLPIVCPTTVNCTYTPPADIPHYSTAELGIIFSAILSIWVLAYIGRLLINFMLKHY